MSSKNDSGRKQQKVSAKQKQARIEAAKEREAKAAAKKARSERIKKIVTVVVCLILVIALCIPTMGLSFCSAM